MALLTRIARYGDPALELPVPEVAHLTPEQRKEYTFILEKSDGERLLIPEMDARKVSPLIEHMGVGNVFMMFE